MLFCESDFALKNSVLFSFKKKIVKIKIPKLSFPIKDRAAYYPLRTDNVALSA